MATSVITNPIIGGGGKWKLKSVTRVNVRYESKTFTPTKNGNLIVYNSDKLTHDYLNDKIWLDGVEIYPPYFYKTLLKVGEYASKEFDVYVSIPSFGSIKIESSDGYDRLGYIYEYEPID